MKFPNPFRSRKERAVVPEVKAVERDLPAEEHYPDTLDPQGLARSLQRTVDYFPVVSANPLIAADSAVVKAKIGDTMDKGSMLSAGAMSPAVAGWFNSQGFIGHHQCALLAQHWLIAKACSMSVEDAVRNGWDVDFKDIDNKAQIDELAAKVKELDKKFKIDDVLIEGGKFANIFGIRVMIPIIESTDKDYYTKQFNIDGITPGAFRGWTQIDPMWIFPLLDSVGASDPSSPHFYEPTFWIAGGKQYHRSHLVILRTDEPADILKPSYMFGGVPLTQRIAERVYAAERTANEAPLLAMSKRTTSLKIDTAKAGMKKNAIIAKLSEWVNYRDNFGVKVIGKDEELNETDTSLADLDVVIMTQYQLTAAIAKTPATKLLGTSPKGFNATGEHELKSYHEFLESIQSSWGDNFLDRHYLLVSKSYLDGVEIEHTWCPVDSIGAEAAATIQKTKAETAAIHIDKGVISPDEERQRLRLDPDSGYTLSDTEEAPGPPDENSAPSTGEDEEETADVLPGIAAAVAVATLLASQEPSPAPKVVGLVRRLAAALATVQPAKPANPVSRIAQTAESSIDPTVVATVERGTSPIPVPEKLQKTDVKPA